MKAVCSETAPLAIVLLTLGCFQSFIHAIDFAILVTVVETPSDFGFSAPPYFNTMNQSHTPTQVKRRTGCLTVE